MYQDRRSVTARVAVDTVLAYERSRGPVVVETSAGDANASLTLIDAAARAGHPNQRGLSADLVSTLVGEVRAIEVKGRGSRGPITLPERELETFRALGDAGWLYVVWNITQHLPIELWLVQAPAALPWRQVTPAL